MPEQPTVSRTPFRPWMWGSLLLAAPLGIALVMHAVDRVNEAAERAH